MPSEEIIAANAEKGYIYVGTIDGNDVWRKFENGYYTYYLDEGYEEVFPIWNTLRGKRLLNLIYADSALI